MKKLLILTIIIMLCTVPATALANSPQPIPYDNFILIDDYTNVSSVQIWRYDKDNNYSETAWSESYK